MVLKMQIPNAALKEEETKRDTCSYSVRGSSRCPSSAAGRRIYMRFPKDEKETPPKLLKEQCPEGGGGF